MIGTVGIASLFVLAASRLSGTLASDYNSSRLFLQCLFILALLEAALLEMVVTRLKSRSLVDYVVFGGFSLLLLIAFVGNSGLDAPVTGGNPPLVLYNKGEDYAAFCATAQEKATGTVVGRRCATPSGDLRGLLRAAWLTSSRVFAPRSSTMSRPVRSTDTRGSSPRRRTLSIT